MSWVAVAVVGGAAIGAIGSNLAAGKQASGQEAAANTQQQMFSTIVGQEQPFLQGGYGAESELLSGLGIGGGGGAGTSSTPTSPGMPTAGPGQGPTMEAPSSTGITPGSLIAPFNPTQAQLESYPGYQFQLGQGDLALQSANSSGGSAISGPALKQLMSFNQGLAAQNYGNYFNQFQTQQTNIFNRLSAIAGMGQNAAGNLGNAGAQLGTGIAGAQAAAGGALAGGIVGATNSIGGAASSIPLYMLLANNNNGLTGSPYAGSAAAGSGPTGEEVSLGGS